ncbi:hypothetical protein M9H77_21739 [Catharanthus roseus]|uniref:Uncharacterized protein n=1 Tax=Catharanthus roseus TaxID=4058 RepID=A0ACC0ASI1_CATRO|nr:hypothetical protein M9H77_21739 [Catharanthus roseus]
MKVNTYLIVTRYLRSRTSDRRSYVTLGCERGGANKSRTKLRVDDEEEVPIKRQGPYVTKNAQKIYNVLAKIKKNRIQGRNTIEEVLCLSVQWSYTVFYRNCDDINVLSDIVIAYPTSIQMMRTWSYVLIIDKTVWTSQVLYFGVETTNRIKSEHSILKIWLSTCHDDLDIVVLNINSLIEGQIAEIKRSLECSGF